MVPETGSITGVPVIPMVGSMSGWLPWHAYGAFRLLAGDPRCCDHSTAPVLEEIEYTVLFSVATKTEPLKESGSA